MGVTFLRKAKEIDYTARHVLTLHDNSRALQRITNADSALTNLIQLKLGKQHTQRTIVMLIAWQYHNSAALGLEQLTAQTTLINWLHPKTR